jgi:WD40 repeat protein
MCILVHIHVHINRYTCIHTSMFCGFKSLCITPIYLYRCISLGADGEVILWNTLTKDYGKIGERKIHSLNSVDDHFRSIEVAYKGGKKEKNVEGFLIANGRQQAVYHVKDTSKEPSLLLLALFSKRLQMIVTVYVHEIAIWDSDNGQLLKKIENIGDSSSIDITAAVLDDRERKVIIGDSNGVVSIYNCATGVILKKYPPISTAVQMIMYSPDKTIIIIGCIGDVFIFDDRYVCEYMCIHLHIYTYVYMSTCRQYMCTTFFVDRDVGLIDMCIYIYICIYIYTHI